MLAGGRKARRIHSPGTSSRYATGKLCDNSLNAVPMQDSWPGLLSLSHSFLPLTKGSIWDRLRLICNWLPGTWALAHASLQCGSRRRPKRSWGFRRTFTLLSRSPLAILSMAASSLPLQNQTGVSPLMRWFSGNGGEEERAVLARRLSHACARSSEAAFSKTEKVVDRSCLSCWYACG